MVLQVKDKVALVTGASKGIGKAISQSLAQAGAKVVLASRSKKQLVEVKETIEEMGGEALCVPTDLTSDEDIKHLFNEIKNHYNQLDILVNNAGTATYGPMVDFPMDDFDLIMKVNLRAVYQICQKALSFMLPKQHGYIINISSVVGFKGYPNQSAYGISKHGIMGLSKSLAMETQKDHIRVSTIMPGGVETDMVRKARPDLDTSVLMKPDEIAETVLYLLSLWNTKAMVDQIYIRREMSTPFK